MPAFFSAVLKAVLHDLLGSPLRSLRTTKSSGFGFRFSCFPNALSKSGRIGTVRVSSFLAYADSTVTDRFIKSTRAPVVSFNSDVRKPVVRAAKIRSRRLGLQFARTQTARARQSLWKDSKLSRTGACSIA